MWEWWWGFGRRPVEVLMSGNGRCQRRRKMMGRGADGCCGTEEKPGPLSRVPASKATAPVSPPPGDSLCSSVDFYSQALKALSERSPFDTAEVLATTLPTLPTALGSGLLARQSEGRKRHKKAHAESKSSKQGSTERPKTSSVWIEYEEYFRELTMSDIDMLHKWSTSFELLVSDSCLLIPVLGNVVRNQVDSVNVSDAPGNVLLQEACVNETALHEETVIVKEEEHTMEIDDKDGDVLFPVALESSSPQQLGSLSSLEWVLGSRDKILLTTERQTKKRKLLGENAGLQRLAVIKSCNGQSRMCHFCSVVDKGDQLNQLVVCSSCDMCVHQKCYGIQGNVEGSWVCSWCKWKSDAEGGEVFSEKGSCVLCPKLCGALKPVQRVGSGNGLSTEFAHLFCSLWMPEVYVDDMRMMEPILNVDRIKETRKKLICYLCKVRQGTCVRCTDGACRTSFHPICAREAGHRLEVWGKLGCDDVELRAFCSKHSHGCDDSQGESISGTVSSLPHSDPCQLPLFDKPPLDDGGGIRRDHVADCLEEPENSNKSTDTELQKEIEVGNLSGKCGVVHTNLPEFTEKESQERSICEVVNPPDFLDLSLVLKKLIDREKVSLKDLASEIGVPADSLAANISDNHFPSELHCKLVKWLGDHAITETSLKKLTVRVSVPSKVDRGGEDAVCPVTHKESDTFDVPVKSALMRRTISSVSVVKDDNILSSCKDPNLNNRGITDDVRAQLPAMEDPNDSREEIVSNGLEKVVFEHIGLQGSSAPTSLISKSNPAGCLKYGVSVDMAEGILVHSATNADCPYGTNIGSESSSYIHPFVRKKIMEILSGVGKKSCKKYDALDFAGPVELKSTPLKQSLTNGICSNWDDQGVSYVDVLDASKGVASDDLIKAKEKGILDLHPEDDVEGELIYFQNWLFRPAAKRKRLSDNLICKIVKNLPQELQMVRKQRWDSVLVHQYLHELREAKKQGRKERKYKEAQVMLAAATAAAAVSSRTLRKDGVDEASQQEDKLNVQIPRGRVGPPSLATPRLKEASSSLALSRNISDKHLDILQLNAPVSKEHPRFCDICGRSETILNPILVCSNCKVAVHLVCYRNVKESTGPWYCELCEDSPAKGSIVQRANFPDKLLPITECSLCATPNGAFRKTINVQWIHALCAEWVFDSTFRRGQANPIGGMESVVRGNYICSVCHRRFGVCIKCNFGPCQSTFHPSCARSAGYYMSVRSVGGKQQQRKAYCDKHSNEQRAKAEGQKHAIEELKSLKQVRVELEKLRLICESIVKREKLKRETVLCSHDLLASKKDTLAFSPLFQNPYFSPEASSDSATSSLKGQTDCSRSCSTIQKSDDATVDSTVSGKRRIKILVSTDADQKTDDSSTSQQLPKPKPTDRMSFPGKHLPLGASLTRRNIQETGAKKLKSKKHTETFEKELIMTSDQASVKNQRLPKGYIYVPIDRLSTEQQTGEDSLGCEQ